MKAACLMRNRICFRFPLIFFLLFLANWLNWVLAQGPVTITGTILDGRTNAPLPNVSVVVKGTTNGTVTNDAGAFSIKATKGETLVFSYAGYQAHEIKIGNETTINYTMLAGTSNNLEEVVVIGYGTMKRKELTGSVASVGGKELEAVPVPNAAQALQGKLPGVSVTTQDGRPDAAVSIRVRGGGSISQSNQPLFIVDGFPVANINDIPSAQIESIDVLKDAASTAIYGARGANGVILVTTKSGKSGKFRISYDGYAQWNEPTKYMETMNAYDYIAYNWAYARAISASYASAWEKLWAIGSSAPTYNNPDGIDHYKNVGAANYASEAYNSSFSNNHNLTISNGNANTRYLFSGSYSDNEGMKVNSYLKRVNALIKLDQKIGKKVDFGFDTRFSNIESMGNESTTNGRGSILSSAYQFRPIATADVLGELDDNINTQLGLYDIVLQDQFNPVARMIDYEPLSQQRAVRSNLGLSWKIIKGLTFRSDLGYSFYWNRGKTWSGAVYNNYINKAGEKTYAGNAGISTSEGWSLRWVNTLNYDVQGLGDNHRLNITLGQEVNDGQSEANSMYSNRFPASFDKERAFANMDLYTVIPGATDISQHGVSSSVGTPNRLTSYFGRVNYTLLDKYIFSGTLRADGSSRFSPSNRWGYFPAGAVAWRVSNEDFMQDVKWINDLKLRVSYGEVGNDGINANLWKPQWQSDGFVRYSINEQQQVAYTPQSTLANPNLKWETTITKNIGLDFSLFQSRVYGTIDLYHNTTKDLLMLTAISQISGFSATYDNVGSTSNKGVEISLGGDIVRKKDFQLSASFNIAFNKGNVDELADGVNGLYKTNWGSTMTQPNTGDYILQEGKPVGQVRGYTYLGWYTTDDFDYANGIYTLKKGVPDIATGILGTVYGTSGNKPGGQTAYPGVVKFKDINGDGVVNEQDVTIIGSMAPKNTGGLNLNASYKGFDLGMNWVWSYGNYVYNADYLAAFYGSKEDGLYRNRLNYLSTSYKIFDIQNGQLTSVTDPAALDALNANATTFLPFHENPVVSTMGIQDGSFLRLNTFTIGYSLPDALIKKAKINRARIYGSIYNALLITSYNGLDPEVNTNSNQGGAQYPTLGLDWGSYPRPRSFTLGLNLEF